MSAVCRLSFIVFFIRFIHTIENGALTISMPAGTLKGSQPTNECSFFTNLRSAPYLTALSLSHRGVEMEIIY